MSNLGGANKRPLFFRNTERKTMITQEIALTKNEFLKDKMPAVTSGLTLIEAPTGVGKSTFVLEKLTEQGPVLMLVPLVLQVRQIKSTIKTDIEKYRFVQGGDLKKTMAADLKGKHIVATYDLLPRLKELIDPSAYILVVDEVHKMYSAGTYRSEAINPILEALTDKSMFKQRVTCTATYTPVLAKLAGIEPDTAFSVSKAGGITRSLMVRRYTQSGPYHWLEFVLKRLTQIKVADAQKLVFVRINSMQRMEEAAAALEHKGYKVMPFSREHSNTPGVRDAISNERLPPGIDVVLTTAILDEAINLKNLDAEVDSVHIVGAVAHPEEVVQFMGRLRTANPPVFLHLVRQIDQDGDDFMASLPDLDDKQQQERLKQNYQAISQLSEAAKAFANSVEVEDYRHEQFMNEINQTLERFAGAKLLSMESGSGGGYVKNEAGILACCYQNDKIRCYGNYRRLTVRLKQLLPSLSVSIETVDTTPGTDLDVIFQQIEEAMQNQREQAAKEVMQVVWQEYDQACVEADRTATSTQGSASLAIRQYAAQRLRELKSPDGYSVNPYKQDKQSLHHRMYPQAIELAVYMSDLVQIEGVLEAGLEHRILKLCKDARSDQFVRALRAELKKLADKNHWGFRLDAKAVVPMFSSAYKVAEKAIPTLRDAVAKSVHQSIRVDRSTGKVEVVPGKALNLIREIADVEEKNAHKPDKRYLTVNGLNLDGIELYDDECLGVRQPSKKKSPASPIKLTEEEFFGE